VSVTVSHFWMHRANGCDENPHCARTIARVDGGWQILGGDFATFHPISADRETRIQQRWASALRPQGFSQRLACPPRRQ